MDLLVDTWFFVKCTYLAENLEHMIQFELQNIHFMENHIL